MNINRATIKTRDTSVMSGIDKHITTSITLSGTPYTPAELKAVFQAQITVIDANDALRKSLADGVASAEATAEKVTGVYQLLRSSLIAQYGKGANAVLNDFGMAVPKAPGAKTVDAKAKRAATRTARHTMGKVQKKAVTGDVVGITVTPVVAGPPAAAPATPVVASAPASPTQPVATPTPTSPAAPVAASKYLRQSK